jgi:flagellar protein FliS
MRQAGYSAYKSAVVQTTKSNEEILLMLYDGVLKFIKFAKMSLTQKHIATKGENISKALAIITELDCALDYQNGAEIAANLGSLYYYMLTRLTHANLHNDLEALEEVEGLLTDLQQGFAASVLKKTSPVLTTVKAAEMPALEGLNVAV